MNKEDNHIKPLMQILFGVGLFVIYYLMHEPIQIVEKYEETNWYDPSDELFLYFIKWACLLGAISLTLIGVAKITKRLISQNGK